MEVSNRNTIHINISYIFAPFQPLNRLQALQLQEAFLKKGIEIATTNYTENEVTLIRNHLNPIEIKIGIIGQQASNIGRFSINAPNPGRSLELVTQEAEDISQCIREVCGQKIQQIIKTDALIRDLYDTQSNHAFQDLWENRLSMSAKQLASFKRPVLGGGIRLFFPIMNDNKDLPQLDLRIESFLQNPKRIFIEARSSWNSIETNFDGFHPEKKFEYIEKTITTEVIQFIKGEQQ